ncbi:MAG: O-antigen ligase family protein [Caldilineaceae bacterium]
MNNLTSRFEHSAFSIFIEKLDDFGFINKQFNLFTLLRESVSFETTFVLFLFAGQYKDFPFFSAIPIDITLLTLIISLLTGFMVLLRERELTFHKFYFIYLYLLFLTYILASWGWFGDSLRILKLQKFVVFNSWSLLGAILVINTPNRIIRFLIIATIFASLLDIEALNVLVTSTNYSFATSWDDSISYNTLGRASSVASFFTLTLFIQAKTKLSKFIFLGITAFYILGVFASTGRGSILCWVASLGLFLIGIKKCYPSSLTLKSFFQIAIILLLLALLLYAVNQQYHLLDRVTYRFRSLSEHVDAGDDDRLLMYQAAARLFMKRPFWGYGWDTWSLIYSPTYRHPHNIFIEVGVELGLVGIFIFLALISYPFLHIKLAIWFSEPLGVLLVISFIYYLLAAQTSGDLTDNRVLFSYLSLLVSYASIKKA